MLVTRGLGLSLRSNDSLDIAGLPESRGYLPRARRALAARHCVDELGVGARAA